MAFLAFFLSFLLTDFDFDADFDFEADLDFEAFLSCSTSFLSLATMSVDGLAALVFLISFDFDFFGALLEADLDFETFLEADLDADLF